MVGETGFEPATPWSRTRSERVAPVSPTGTPSQPRDSVAPPGGQESHQITTSAPELRPWTAGGLRESRERPEARTAVGPPGTKQANVPAVQLELFLEAGANVAAQAARAGASKEQVEDGLRIGNARGVRPRFGGMAFDGKV